MYATNNSTLVWKRLAAENQQSARLLARISAGLLVLLIGVGVYAYSAESRFSQLCTSLEKESHMASSPHAREMGRAITTAYCR